MTAMEARDRFDDELRALLDRAEHVSAGARREGSRDLPLGPKAARTRASIIDAGIEVFCERGYPNCSVADVHERAGVSLGTYYQYFRDKSDLIATIVAETVIDAAAQIFQTLEPDQGQASAQRVVHGFVRHYASTAPFQRVWEQATHLEPEVAELRHRLSRLLEASLGAAIADGQETGHIRTQVDPTIAARALSAMVDRTCYLTFVVDEAGRGAVDPVTDTLSALWARALGLEAGA